MSGVKDYQNKGKLVWVKVHLLSHLGENSLIPLDPLLYLQSWPIHFQQHSPPIKIWEKQHKCQAIN